MKGFSLQVANNKIWKVEVAGVLLGETIRHVTV